MQKKRIQNKYHEWMDKKIVCVKQIERITVNIVQAEYRVL